MNFMLQLDLNAGGIDFSQNCVAAVQNIRTTVLQADHIDHKHKTQFINYATCREDAET